MKANEMPGQATAEVPCSQHPSAPHGFNRNASHNNNRYTCECEGWEEEMRDDITETLGIVREKIVIMEHTTDAIDEQINFMKGLDNESK
jgi:hypothetical protein